MFANKVSGKRHIQFRVDTDVLYLLPHILALFLSIRQSAPNFAPGLSIGRYTQGAVSRYH